MYNPSIPQPNDDLSDSQGDILNNFSSANTTFDIDHYTFNNATANRGRHKDIHIVTRVGNAGNTSGAYTLFSKDYTPDSTGAVADTQLFGITANGGVSQLSGNNAQADGWVWCGGLLLQWGVITITSSSQTGTVTFKDRVAGAIPFPTNCFNVQLSLDFTGSVSLAGASTYLVTGAPSNTDFNWAVQLASTATTRKMFWFAVGN